MTDLLTAPTARNKTAVRPPAKTARNRELLQAIAAYWNAHIHDLAVAKHPPGTAGFFRDLDEYRFDKLRYLPEVVNFNGYRDRRILEVGCGLGIDLLRFAKGGALVTGVDLAQQSIDLARKNFQLNGAAGEFYVMDGEALEFENDSFDVVYAHGVLQYTAEAAAMVQELHRVLKPGGEAIMMVYNRLSWLNAMSKIMKVDLEHEDAPVLNKYSIAWCRSAFRWQAGCTKAGRRCSTTASSCRASISCPRFWCGHWAGT
ncbi:class I SAM-dependent methyltransferase [candidate division KSB1 bacterium]|nr:class I SAM-dependent methyltransferase [candidate division KSB1 bacterium]